MKQNNETQPSDIAALSAAVVAGAVAVFMSPGPYEWMSGVISLTLVAILTGYVLNRKRTIVQSVAVSTVFAFSLLPLAGLIHEYIIQNNLEGICIEQCCSSIKTLKSSVTDLRLFLTWLILVILFTFIDRFIIQKNHV